MLATNPLSTVSNFLFSKAALHIWRRSTKLTREECQDYNKTLYGTVVLWVFYLQIQAVNLSETSAAIRQHMASPFPPKFKFSQP